MNVTEIPGGGSQAETGDPEQKDWTGGKIEPSGREERGGIPGFREGIGGRNAATSSLDKHTEWVTGSAWRFRQESSGGQTPVQKALTGSLEV